MIPRPASVLIDRRASPILGLVTLAMVAVVFVAAVAGALGVPEAGTREVIIGVAAVVCGACALFALGLIRFFMTVSFDGRDLVISHRRLFRTVTRRVHKSAYLGVEYAVRKVRLSSGGRRSRWVDYHVIRLVPRDAAPEIELDVSDDKTGARARWEGWARRFGLPALSGEGGATAKRGSP